jgi:hypothetical protein
MRPTTISEKFFLQTSTRFALPILEARSIDELSLAAITMTKPLLAPIVFDGSPTPKALSFQIIGRPSIGFNHWDTLPRISAISRKN